jgi:uracil-DNA glycosylase family 4
MDIYNELLDATIAHLETLKRSGTKYLVVSPETLKGLDDIGRATVRLGRQTGQTGQAGRLSYPTPAARVAGSKPVPKAQEASPIILANNQDKAAAIAELRQRALVCQKCPSLVSSRKNVVFGVGSIDAQLMFVGEAPGADEDIQGEPFVGRAGQLLTKIIQTTGLEREQVYIANILKCRPDTPEQSYGNRPPKPEEMERCLPYLHAQIDLIKPRAIVALGATAVDGLFGKVPGIGITKLRGKWREYRGIPVMPTYHPSYLLRPNPQNVKREAWEDMMQVMERLGMPISEKQRGYFLAKTA